MRRSLRGKATFQPYTSTIYEDAEDDDDQTLNQSATPQSSRRVLSTCVKAIVGALCFITLLLIAYVYVVSVHRLRNVSALSTAIQVMRLPNFNKRCKIFNSSHFHCLPNIFFIGASKCGTTSVTDYLAAHPNIRFVNRRVHSIDSHREVHRFDRNTYGWAMKEIDLADEWASTPLVTDVNTPVIHYTPHYLYAPTVPYEMRDFYPHSEDLKFIVMLRNPVDRAVSSYWFQNSHLFHEHDRGEKIMCFDDIRIPKTSFSGSMKEFEVLSSREMKQRLLKILNSPWKSHFHIFTIRRIYEECMAMHVRTNSTAHLGRYGLHSFASMLATAGITVDGWFGREVVAKNEPLNIDHGHAEAEAVSRGATAAAAMKSRFLRVGNGTGARRTRNSIYDPTSSLGRQYRALLEVR